MQENAPQHNPSDDDVAFAVGESGALMFGNAALIRRSSPVLAALIDRAVDKMRASVACEKQNQGEAAQETRNPLPLVRIKGVPIHLFASLLDYLHTRYTIAASRADLAKIAVCAQEFRIAPLALHCCQLAASVPSGPASPLPRLPSFTSS